MRKYLPQLKKTPLFRGTDPRLLQAALDEAELCELSAGERVDFSGKLGFVLSGQVNVFSADPKRSLLIRRIAAGDLFGAAALFGGGPSSRLTVRRSAKLLFFGADTVRRMLERDGRLAFNYIEFLSECICYLGDRITYLSAGSAIRRLAVFFDSFGEDAFTLPVSLCTLADMLDIGRASLYRALDRLIADGCIEKTGSRIVIKDRDVLLKYE